MKLIITATTRPEALSLKTAHIVKGIYSSLGEDSVSICDLKKVPFQNMMDQPYQKATDPTLKSYLELVAKAKALIVICPEYNGGIPGTIKHFMDHWSYPDSFVYKPVCLIGIGGKFGALNPISHLQSIFLYRHSFVFPIRVFIQNISEVVKEEQIADKNISHLLHKQAKNFIRFVKALENQNFD